MNTLNGLPLLLATVRSARIGPWIAEVEFRSEDAVTGAVTLEIEGATLSGYLPVSTEKSPARYAGAVVGGAGGLDTQLAAKQYVAPTVELVLSDIARKAGESLSATIESSLLSRSLTTWQRAAGTAKQAVAAMANSLGVSWRILTDGTLWLGAETWPEVDPEHRLLDDDQATGTVTTSLLPSLQPGQTFRGLRLELVTHTIGTKEGRTEASKTSPAAAIRSLLSGTEQRIQYSRPYSARVVAQNADGTLQVRPDDPVFQGSGVDKVRIRLGVPGTCTVPKGAHVVLRFDGGDPQQPIATGFHDGSLTMLLLGAGTDFVALAAKVADELTAQKTWDDAHVHPTGFGPSGAPSSPRPTPASVAATKVKAE
jgi:hypothetical protein